MERQSIGQIGVECNAMARSWGIEWPKLTAVFSTFTAKAVPFAGGGGGGGRTRESRGDKDFSLDCPPFYFTRWL